MMNPILKEIIILEVKDYLTDEALADFASKEYNVEGAALVAYINLNYTELFDDPAEKTKLILEDNAEGYSIRSMISEYEDAFYGTHRNVAEFASFFYENYYNNEYNILYETYLLDAMDWNLYWTRTLQFDWYFSGDYFFRNL